MILNYGWVLLNLFTPILVIIFIITTLLLEGLVLNYYLKRPILAIVLTIIANLGSFLVGLPMSNFQYLISNGRYVATEFSLYYNLISRLSGVFSFNISPFLFSDLVFFSGLLSLSTYLEFVIIKPFFLKDRSINLRTIFQVNLVSHTFFLGGFFVLGFLDAISVLPIETLFVQRVIISSGNIDFVFVWPYLLIMAFVGLAGFGHLLSLIIDDTYQESNLEN